MRGGGSSPGAPSPTVAIVSQLVLGLGWQAYPFAGLDAPVTVIAVHLYCCRMAGFHV